MRHHLAGEQRHRRLGLGVADHPEIHLQRGRFEAVDLAIVGGDRLADIVRRADPGRAFLHLRLERLLGDDLDRLLVVRVVARGHAGHPVRGGVDDRSQILVERLARDRGGLLAGLRAIHVERQHHLAAAGMAGLRSRRRDRPSAASPCARRPAECPSDDARAARHSRTSPRVDSAAIQNGGRGFCVGRGSDVTSLKLWKRPSAVTFSSSSRRRTCSSPSSKRARLSSIEMPKRANSCGRNARAKPTSTRPAGDRVDHADLAGELERIVEHRQHRAGDEPDRARHRRGRAEEDQRVGAVAAIGMEIVLDRPHIG